MEKPIKPVGGDAPGAGKLKDYSRKNHPYLSGIDPLEKIFSLEDLRSILSELHKYDDVDADGFAHHHTLGTRADQALPGSFGLLIYHVGEIRFFAENDAPKEFIRANGATKDTEDYPHLAAYLGETGSTFNVPNITLSGTVPFICTVPVPDLRS
jgi:hypothetical protein